MQPHVFVVMPFDVKEVRAAKAATAEGGAGEPALSLDFDEIYDLLIAPALRRADCAPFRADKEPGAGDIRTDMYFELVTADVVLADISILNPNVFYELGVRHGVAPRGVLMIHGGWTRRPFDVAPDRTFDYDGKLFSTEADKRDEDWDRRLAAEVERLGLVLRAALDADERTIGSPVYKELHGLKPADWSEVETARAKYFDFVFADWEERVEAARLNGRPGDILTLADDVPTRFHHVRLLWKAANALRSMHRFAAALTVVDELLALDREHRDALPCRGLLLGRLGRINDAKVHMKRIAETYAGDTEVQGILGRTYKDFWRQGWKSGKTVEDRQKLAVMTAPNIVSAIKSYERAARDKFDYYNGINVVSAIKLLEHLRAATGKYPTDCNVAHFDDLVSVVRYSAQIAFDAAGADSEAGMWAKATLAELALVAGTEEDALALYGEAAFAPGATQFGVNSMLEQVRLFASLGFRPAAVAEVENVLKLKLAEYGQTGDAHAPVEGRRFGKVVVASGHMTDTPRRVEEGRAERFPERKVEAVRELVAAQLEKWGVGAGDLAICGGARGADLIFAELCAGRGARVWLFLPTPEGEFLDKSVRSPGTNWESLFYDLKKRGSVETFFQQDRLKSPPKGASVYARNNLWMLNTARVEADEPENLYAVLVWDEQPAGDGPGGTSDFAARVRRLGGHLSDPIINPTKL